MNPNSPNNGGGAPNEGAAGGGKKKQRKNRNSSGQQNAPNDQQPKSHTNVEQKSQEKQQQEQFKSGKNDFPQMSQTITPQNKSDNKQQLTQKQNQPMETKPPKAKKSKGGVPPATITAIDSAPTPGLSSNEQNQPTQKQNQPKEKKPSKAAKQPKGEVTTTNTASKPEKKEELSSNAQQIEQQIAILKNNLSIPKRKSMNTGGTLGRKTEIEVNHLPLNLDKLFKKTVYHIDVKFNPELPKRLLRNALEEFNRKHYPNVQFAFDGRRNMYTTKELKSVTDLVSIINEENNKTIEFTIVTAVVNVIQMSKINEYLKTGSSNCTPGEAFQALDIILKNRPFGLRFVNIGRSFFPVPRNIPVDLGEGMELWKGFFQSPVMGWKPFLNIDVAHKGFPKYQSLVDYIKNEMRCNLDMEMDNRCLQLLLTYVKGLKVDFIVPNQPNTKRSYKVVGLLESASRFYFDMEDKDNKTSKSINVFNYFKTTRNYHIKYPNLPCLHVGNIAKKTAIPIELCMVQRGQLRLKKLTENQTANMVRNAARPPSDRRQTIENCIRDINYNRDTVLKEFGIEVTDKFASIPARVLEQPSLAYAQNRETKPRAGVWRPDKFSKSAIIQNWVILNLDCMRIKPPCLKDVEKYLIASGRELNVDVKAMNPIINCEFPRHLRIAEIQKDITKKFHCLKDKVSLIVVVIPDYPTGLYAAVKQSSELTVGVLTQCIKSKTVLKMNPSTANNILLKINSKLNGINHTLALKSSPPSMAGAIIFGADVTHPSPDQLSIPSVAAVAASHDLHGSQYNMEWRLQSPKVEIIQDLEDIVHKQLCKFKNMTKTVPKKIFYFRDGVSEGQFLQLLESELISIRRACLRLSINYKPAITFLVVQKRHHTRMFPKFPADMDGKFANVPSGTIIDTQITHPTELDFYLCSHASIQGTSRPTKYHLIWDDNNLSDNELEQLTFYLCFLFVRCTRSVSYPAPTYYAHLAAFRARAYIENKDINLDRLSDEQKLNELNSAFVTNTPMFFV